MTSTTSPGLARWQAGLHRALDEGVMDDAAACLHPDVTFRSPVVHKPYEGAAITGAILHAVSQVFQNFTYTDIIDGGDTVGLVFTADVGDRQVEGWDYLKFDEDGLITDFTVMVRPLSGITALAEAMQAKLTELGYA